MSSFISRVLGRGQSVPKRSFRGRRPFAQTIEPMQLPERAGEFDEAPMTQIAPEAATPRGDVRLEDPGEIRGPSPRPDAEDFPLDQTVPEGFVEALDDFAKGADDSGFFKAMDDNPELEEMLPENWEYDSVNRRFEEITKGSRGTRRKPLSQEELRSWAAKTATAAGVVGTATAIAPEQKQPETKGEGAGEVSGGFIPGPDVPPEVEERAAKSVPKVPETRAEKEIAKQLGIADVRMYDSLQMAAQKLEDTAPKNETPWYMARLDEAKVQLQEATKLYATTVDQIQDEKTKKENILAWAEVAEILGHSLVQLGAANYGLRNGYNLSGLKFNKTNWDAKYDRIQSAAEIKMNAALTKFKESQETFRDTQGEVFETFREEEKIKARQQEGEKDRLLKLLLADTQNEFDRVMKERELQVRKEIEAMRQAGDTQRQKARFEFEAGLDAVKTQNDIQKAQALGKVGKSAEAKKLAEMALKESVEQEEALRLLEGMDPSSFDPKDPKTWEAQNELLVKAGLSPTEFKMKLEEADAAKWWGSDPAVIKDYFAERHLESLQNLNQARKVYLGDYGQSTPPRGDVSDQGVMPPGGVVQSSNFLEPDKEDF